MENVKKALIIMPFVLGIEIIAFFYLIFRGLRGEPMPAFGLVIMGQLLFIRYLSTFYRRYKESIAKPKKPADPPQYMGRWSFNPLDRDGSIDEYLDKLLDFLDKNDGEVFLPSKSQEFVIWWESEHADEWYLTDRVIKMVHEKDGQILIETTSGSYIGQTLFNNDYMMRQELNEGGE